MDEKAIVSETRELDGNIRVWATHGWEIQQERREVGGSHRWKLGVTMILSTL